MIVTSRWIGVFESNIAVNRCWCGGGGNRGCRWVWMANIIFLFPFLLLLVLNNQSCCLSLLVRLWRRCGDADLFKCCGEPCLFWIGCTCCWRREVCSSNCSRIHWVFLSCFVIGRLRIEGRDEWGRVRRLVWRDNDAVWFGEVEILFPFTASWVAMFRFFEFEGGFSTMTSLLYSPFLRFTASVHVFLTILTVIALTIALTIAFTFTLIITLMLRETLVNW